MLNREISSLKPSKSIEFMEKAKKLQKNDSGIINLAGGEPDFDTPKRIRDEIVKQLDAGFTHYTVGPGLPELRDKIALKLKTENNCSYSADGIIVTPGGKYAIYIAIRTLVNEGDEVMYLDPGWVSYPSIIEASKAKPVAVKLKFDDNYELTLEKLENACTEKTKVLITNYPNNPTGKVLSESEANILKTFMINHPDITVISDEIYERIIYTGFSNFSLASIDEIKDRVITINGFSKSVAMTGFRVGYLAAPEKVSKEIYKLFQHTISCVSGFIQKSAIVALDCNEEVEAMRVEYESRRNLFVGNLNAIDGVECNCPEGAFYAFVKFDLNGMSSEEVCDYILTEGKVVGVPGNAYGTDECCVRFSFASSEVELKKASENIKTAIEKLKGE